MKHLSIKHLWSILITNLMFIIADTILLSTFVLHQTGENVLACLVVLLILLSSISCAKVFSYYEKQQSQIK